MSKEKMFITLEGIEGSGKTTQISKLVPFLESKGIDCVTTREPGGTRVGRQIRSILLNPENKEITPLAELLLYAADRSQHVETIIKPCLQSGKAVICDRFFDATTVYQGYARGLDMALINRLHDMVLGAFRPDITLLFDLPAEIGLGRAWESLNKGKRSQQESRFEKEALSFHEKVRSGYLDLAKADPDRFHIIDAAKEPEDVFRQIVSAVSPHLKKGKSL